MDKKKTLLLYIALILYGLSLWEWPPHSPDLGWHLLGGKWILENGKVPGADFINSFNATWHDYHWLGQVIFYKVYSFGGYEALQLFVGLCLATLFKLLVDIIRLIDTENKLPLLVTLLLSLFSARAVAQVASVRPQIILLLLLALSLKILLQKKPFELFKICVLTVLAVNIHVYWVFIPILWGALRVVPTINSISDREMLKKGLVGFVLLTLSGFISPYGIIPFMQSGEHPFFINYALLFDYLLMPETLQNSIGEMKNVFAAKGILPSLLLLVIALFGHFFTVKLSKERFGALFLFLFALLLSIRSLKFVAVFAVFSLPWLVRAISVGLEIKTPKPKVEKAYMLLASLSILYFGGMAGYHFPYTNSKYSHVEAMLPIGACREMAKLNLSPKNEDHVRVLTHFNYGGWCRWILDEEAPEKDFRVTTDGRTQWVDPARIKASFDLFSLKGQWRNTLSKWNPDIALVWKQSQLAQLMALDPANWKLVYQDSSFAVFLPQR